MATIILFLETNITLIKDIVTVIFYSGVIILSLLTYLKARKTILQPLRTEVIKNQTKILTDLLKHLTRDNELLFEKIDYFNIVKLNIFMHLDELGYRIKEHDETKESMEEISSGMLIVGDEDELPWASLTLGLEEKEEEKEEEKDEYEKALYSQAKNGKFVVDRLYITKKNQRFVNEIEGYRNSPYMPRKIQNILSTLLMDISNSLSEIMRKELENLINQFCVERVNGNTKINITPTGVYNSFIHKSTNHKMYIEKLIDEIRAHLRIDDNW